MKMQINGLQVEVFYVSHNQPWNRGMFPIEGYYWWVKADDLKPDSEPYGPFTTELEAQQDVINTLQRMEVA